MVLVTIDYTTSGSVPHGKHSKLTLLPQVHNEVVCDRIPLPDAGDAGGDGEREAHDLSGRNCERCLGNKYRILFVLNIFFTYIIFFFFFPLLAHTLLHIVS